jgi:large subunit ribosomal protein L31
MKTDIHPEYNAIVFRDLASGETFLTRSTLTSEKTIELDGATYPVIDVEISSASHPFYTGKQRILDSAGRVEKFNQRFKGFGATASIPRERRAAHRGARLSAYRGEGS